MILCVALYVLLFVRRRLLMLFISCLVVVGGLVFGLWVCLLVLLWCVICYWLLLLFTCRALVGGCYFFGELWLFGVWWFVGFGLLIAVLVGLVVVVNSVDVVSFIVTFVLLFVC